VVQRNLTGVRKHLVRCERQCAVAIRVERSTHHKTVGGGYVEAVGTLGDFVRMHFLCHQFFPDPTVSHHGTVL